MKTVLIMRHGKSDWGASFRSDDARPLADRGRRSAELMGRFITAAGLAPDLAITSPAVRARDTLDIAAAAGRWEATKQEEPGLYDGGALTVIDIVRRTGQEVDILLLAGHQPTWANLTSHLIGGGSLAFPTAAVACVDLRIERWADSGPGRGELRWFVPPRLLDGLPAQ